MAEGVKDGFTSWLSSYLSERSIDLDVYLDYICGIAYASGEGEEEELISSLEEVLSGPVDALGNCSSTVRTIVEKWKQLILTGSNSAVEGTASVKDSGTNLLSEVHDRVLAASAQERQDVVVTVPHHHPKLDSQEKQKMIEAYGNLEEEDCADGTGNTSTTSGVCTDLLPNVNTRLVVDEQRKVRERQKQEHEAKLERDKQNKQKQLQKAQDRKEKEKKRTQKQERRR